MLDSNLCTLWNNLYIQSFISNNPKQTNIRWLKIFERRAPRNKPIDNSCSDVLELQQHQTRTNTSLTIIIRLLRRTGQASGGWHFNDFTRHTLWNASTTVTLSTHYTFALANFYLKNVKNHARSANDGFSKRFAQLLEGGKSKIDSILLRAAYTAGFEDGRTNDANCCQSIFKRCQAARYFRLTARRAKIPRFPARYRLHREWLQLRVRFDRNWLTIVDSFSFFFSRFWGPLRRWSL